MGAGRERYWLRKPERGYVRKGWPKCYIGLVRNGALAAVFSSPNPDNIQREA